MNVSALTVARSLKAEDVLAALDRAVTERGVPGNIRSDNGPEFISKVTRQYLQEKGIKTLYIEPGSPWQNPYVESFHNRLRDECLNQEWFLSLAEARVVIENWRDKYDRIHPHRNLGFLSPDMIARYWQQAKQRVLGSRSGYAFPTPRTLTTTNLTIYMNISPARVSFDLVRSLGSDRFSPLCAKDLDIHENGQ